MNQEDVESIKELKNGSQLAFASIYKLYANRAYLLAFKYFGDKYMAEDAVQNAFIKLWNNTGYGISNNHFSIGVFRFPVGAYCTRAYRGSGQRKD